MPISDEARWNMNVIYNCIVSAISSCAAILNLKVKFICRVGLLSLNTDILYLFVIVKSV